MIVFRRVVLPGDPAESFVIDTWARSYLDAARGGRDGCEAPRELAHHLARAMGVPTITTSVYGWLRQTLRAGAQIWLAQDEPAEVPEGQRREPVYLGWACASPGALHYVYVKRRLRKSGLASRLLHHCVVQHGVPLRTCTSSSWPWVMDWLERNQIIYQPRNHGS